MLRLDPAGEVRAFMQDELLRHRGTGHRRAGPDVDDFGCNQLAVAATEDRDVARDDVAGDRRFRRHHDRAVYAGHRPIDAALNRQIARRPQLAFDEDRFAPQAHTTVILAERADSEARWVKSACRKSL